VSEQEDHTISELYQQAEDVTSPQHLDDNILAMAKLHAEENRAKPWFQVQRYGAIASACVVVIALSVVFIQPNTEQTLNEESWIMSPGPNSEQSSFVPPSPNVTAKPVSSVGAVSLKAVPASLNVAEKMVQLERKQEIIVASPESFLDSIEQLIEENKLAVAQLRFNDFASQYPKLAQLQNNAYAVKKLKNTNVSEKHLSDELSTDRDSSRLMGLVAESDVAETSIEESEHSSPIATEINDLNHVPEHNRLRQRVNAIIHALSSVSKMPQ